MRKIALTRVFTGYSPFHSRYADDETKNEFLTFKFPVCLMLGKAVSRTSMPHGRMQGQESTDSEATDSPVEGAGGEQL